MGAHLIQAHRHSADERLHTGGALVVGSPESSANVLIVQHLHLKREVLLEVLEYHDQERELDAEGLTGIGWARDESRRNVGAHDLQHGGLDVLVGDSLDVPVSHFLVPYLERFRPAMGIVFTNELVGIRRQPKIGTFLRDKMR